MLDGVGAPGRGPGRRREGGLVVQAGMGGSKRGVCLGQGRKVGLRYLGPGCLQCPGNRDSSSCEVNCCGGLVSLLRIVGSEGWPWSEPHRIGLIISRSATAGGECSRLREDGL